MKPPFSHWLIVAVAVFIQLAPAISQSNAEVLPPRKSPRVVVVSVDAAADWLVDEFLARGVLPADGAFATMSRSGLRAEAMIPVNVASTSPSHISMFTGAHPDRTGIVANSFLQAGDSIGRGSRGFNVPIKAETLWSAAARQGKRVICSPAVGADSTSSNRSCTLTFAYPRLELRPSVVWLAPSSGGPWRYGDQRFEYARPLTVSVQSPGALEYKLESGAVPLYALAVDRTFDGKEAFEAIVLDRDRDLSNGSVGALREGEWAQIDFSIAGRRLGSWIRCLTLKPDLFESAVYLGSVGSIPGGPAEYLREIEERVGLWPGEVDNQNQNAGLITEEVWLEQAERLTSYLKDLVLFNLKRPQWDLLLTYLPILDDVEHRYLLRDPRQADYEAENGQRRARYARRVEWAYQQVDKVLKEWMDAAPPETNFIVVSDHGMVPTHTTVLINQFLAELGFKVQPEDQAEVRAQVDGASAHIYVNVAGRQKNGLIAPDQLDTFVDRIAQACRSVRDPLTNEPIFPVVLKRSELDRLRLNYETHAGDVFISARPGWSLSRRVLPEVPMSVMNTFRSDTRQEVAGNKETVEFLLSGGANETGLGVHGHVSAHREIQAIFFAYGPDVLPRLSGPVDIVDVAPTVTALLGIEPPRDTQGKAIFNPPRAGVGSVSKKSRLNDIATEFNSEARGQPSSLRETLRECSLLLRPVPAQNPLDRCARHKTHALAMVRSMGDRGIAELALLLSDENVGVRRNAVLLLIELGGGYADGQKMKTRDALPALLEATYDSDVAVRAWAAHAIAEVGPSASSAFPRLVELLLDPESAPRNTAAIALGRMGAAAIEAAPALRAAAAAACESDSRKIVCKAIQRIEGVTPSVCRPAGDR